MPQGKVTLLHAATVGKVPPVHTLSDTSRDDPNNYRPITVLPTIARFERLLYDQMHTYLADNKLQGNQQFGF